MLAGHLAGLAGLAGPASGSKGSFVMPLAIEARFSRPQCRFGSWNLECLELEVVLLPVCFPACTFNSSLKVSNSLLEMPCTMSRAL